MAELGKRAYHHGQLRRALLDAALELANTRGIHSFTLRELARAAGVSHAAPYHHFADKSALMTELALEIFHTLRDTLQAAWDEAPGPPDQRFSATGVAYVRFALENPAAFRLMFRPELFESATSSTPEAADSPLMQAGQEAFAVLLNAVQACQAAGSIAPGDPYLPAVSAWSLVHGLSTLLLDGVAGPFGDDNPDAREQMIASVVRTLRYGLMAPSSSAAGPATENHTS
jgi:AcrR family transcriptional regulator